MGYSTTVSAAGFDSVYGRSIRSIPAKKTRVQTMPITKEYITLNIEDIIPYENNPRINDDAVADVVESIKQN